MAWRRRCVGHPAFAGASRGGHSAEGAGGGPVMPSAVQAVGSQPGAGSSHRIFTATDLWYAGGIVPGGRASKPGFLMLPNILIFSNCFLETRQSDFCLPVLLIYPLEMKMQHFFLAYVTLTSSLLLTCSSSYGFIHFYYLAVLWLALLHARKIFFWSILKIWC